MSDPGAPPPPPPPPPDDAWRPPPPSGGGYGRPDQPPYGQPPAPPYAQGPPLGYGQPPTWGQQQPYGYPMPAQTEGTAIGALIASILSWMFCPVIPAIVALAMIPSAKRKIDESQGRLTGEGLLTAAKWVSWANIAFYGLLVGLVILLIIGGVIADTSSTSSDFSFG